MRGRDFHPGQFAFRRSGRFWKISSSPPAHLRAPSIFREINALRARREPVENFFLRSNSHVSARRVLQSKRDTYATNAPLSPLRPATSGFLSDTWLITSIIHERYKELIFNELATVRTNVVTPLGGNSVYTGLVMEAFAVARVSSTERKVEGKEGTLDGSIYVPAIWSIEIIVDISRKLMMGLVEK